MLSLIFQAVINCKILTLIGRISAILIVYIQMNLFKELTLSFVKLILFVYSKECLYLIKNLLV